MPRAATIGNSLHPLLRALRMERMLQDLNLRDLEKTTGYSDSSLCNIENGNARFVNFFMVSDYANALGYELRLCPVSSKPIIPTLPISTTSPALKSTTDSTPS